MGTNKTKKDKRFEKFVEKQVKKEERATLFEKLSKSTYHSSLLRSTKTLGRKTETQREKLVRAATEERLGMQRTDATVRLYVSERDADAVGSGSGQFARVAEDPAAQLAAAGKRKRKKGKSKGKGKGKEKGEGADGDEDEDEEAGGAQGAVAVAAADAPAEPVDPAAAAESLKRTLDAVVAGSALASTTVVRRKRQKKGRVLAQLGLVEQQTESESESSEFDSSASEPEEEEEGSEAESEAAAAAEKEAEATVSPQVMPEAAASPPKPKPKAHYTGSTIKPLLVARGILPSAPTQPAGKTHYVSVTRSDEIQQQRSRLPVYGEEQQIMEAIGAHPVVVLSGETGSGKTTQVPQFLVEAGYGDPASGNPGMVGITQPRRVAALSMAHRVAQELGSLGHAVAHQVRFDTTVGADTRVKFMTEGVLLRELAGDLLLSRYSALVIDEAHERSLNTDILLGVLSRVVRLRERLAAEQPGVHRRLRLVIMSATLRVDDFVKNARLFRVPPPVIKVQARQHAVRVHFARRTPAPGQHLAEAVRKVGRIHRRLPAGGILVFLTGQAEITHVCKRLREEFGQAGGEGEGEAAAGEPGRVEAGDAEDEDVDLGGGDLAAAPDDDDFAMASSDDDDDDADDEDAEPVIVGGDADAEGRQQLLGESLRAGGRGGAAGRLHVLPLYSLLPAAQQLRVFAAPPAGARLCVVATNVAETSITIPGIRYVVDAGLAKQKTFDAQTQVQRFAVQWTSQAAADQRMGRAGRTGPGHCYRLFSSAVFNDQFARFSQPEIARMPLEGVVLQMKAMGLDAVANFPFPTPPARAALRRAEQLLGWLGALDAEGRATDLGRLMSVFPVAPRFARMLVAARQGGCLPYVVAVVAALSVGDPFVRDHALDAAEAEAGGPDDGGAETRSLDSAELAARERRRALRRRYWAAQARLAGARPTSDVLKWLTAVGAYEYAGATQAAADAHFLRPKAMREIAQLRAQLAHLVHVHCPGAAPAGAAGGRPLRPPSAQQQTLIRQIVLAGFVDQVAVRADLAGGEAAAAGGARPAGLRATAYVTMWGGEPVFVHPESVVHAGAQGQRQQMPAAVVYGELQHTSRLWAKVVTAVDPAWLATVARPLCSFGNPLPYPLPQYNAARDRMVCHVEPRFGPRAWPLPSVKVEQTRTGTRWQISKVIG
ncbi:putative ATP-dependent RNA helicase DHR1 [Coemansia erecta]|uniref:RNA helicase n=1 Tax=Coemansia erecta TaxID=147472 RepID=A0A9W7Y4M7_9FUNG|nr:putative ATP-dependent RNA helicase DHR1 [Coemansia erecta]